MKTIILAFAALTACCAASKLETRVTQLERMRGARTLADMITAGGYGWVDSDITEKHFPVKPERFTTSGLEIIHFNKWMTTAQVEAELDKRGIRPATIEELLAYGAENPEEQRKHFIIALGSSWVLPDGGRDVPYLFEDGDGRKLNLLWDRPGYRWRGGALFLVVRK